MSTVPLSPSNFLPSIIVSCLETPYSRETLHTNSWLAKPVELLLHTFLSGSDTCRRLTAHWLASLCLLSQCSCRLVILPLGRLTPLFSNNLPLSPTSPLSPQPPEPPSLQYTRRSDPRPNCHQATPSFDHARRKWYCSVCQDVFHDKYECERHIGNVGKQAICLACGKVVCSRKDNRKRHYIKYCKRMDLGKDGGLSLQDAFVEV